MPHMKTAARTYFPKQTRFTSEKYRSPGPVYDSVSSLGKQVVSFKATAGGIGFGTSTRAHALKTYATYTT